MVYISMLRKAEVSPAAVILEGLWESSFVNTVSAVTDNSI